MQVGALSSDIGQLKSKGAAANGLAEKLQELERKTEDRQMRAETAIYQVGATDDTHTASGRQQFCGCWSLRLN